LYSFRTPCPLRTRRALPEIALNKGSRRADSNRGPLRYERSELTSPVSGQLVLPCRSRRWESCPRLALSAGFGGLRGPPVRPR
jgi:hypothetical protein